MPYDEVMSKFKVGTLKSGSDKGPPVKSRQQAVAIMMSEKRQAAKGKKEYQAHDEGGPVADTSPGMAEAPQFRSGGGSSTPPSTAESKDYPLTPKSPGAMIPMPLGAREQGNEGRAFTSYGVIPEPKDQNPKAKYKVLGPTEKWTSTKIHPERKEYKKGGTVKKYNKGGEICGTSAEKQFKNNLVETAANPTGKMALAKGGSVSKPSWRRW
jgi:hypothetical protein